MAEEAGERTESATQQRREEFRKRGEVANTRELATFLILFSSALIVWALGKFFLQEMTELFQAELGPFVIESARKGDYQSAVVFASQKLFFILAPLLTIAAILGVASTVLQTGIITNEEALQINFERLNPINGFGRMFSLKAAVEGIKSTIKVSMVIAIAYMILKDDIVFMPHLMTFSVQQLLSYLGGILVRLFGGVAIFMAVLSALDYGFQWWDLEKRMKMSKQEIKEEHKNREGDPLIRQRVRRLQREIANRRMMTDVPKADVIITNPTHIAVALKYDKNDPSPRLIAKGADLIAEKIKSLAKEHNIPIVENKPLARTIYKSLKIGEWIPRELFHAVAEVLAYVFKLKRKVLR